MKSSCERIQSIAGGYPTALLDAQRMKEKVPDKKVPINQLDPEYAINHMQQQNRDIMVNIGGSANWKREG
jgi:hypothetical protein